MDRSKESNASEEFVEAPEHPPQRKPGTKLDAMGGAYDDEESALYRGPKNKNRVIESSDEEESKPIKTEKNESCVMLSDEEADVSYNMDDYEKQTLLQVMKLSQQTAVEEEKFRKQSQEEEKQIIPQSQDMEEKDQTQIEKYCATPQGKCMKEDKERTPSRTPGRTPNRTPAKTPRRTPGIADKSLSVVSPGVDSRTPQRTSMAAGMSPMSASSSKAHARVETLTPSGVRINESVSEFQVLSPVKRTPAGMDPTRSIKKNKRRSVCLGGLGELGFARGDRASSPEVSL